MDITEIEWANAIEQFYNIQYYIGQTMLVKKRYISNNHVLDAHYYYIITTNRGFDRMKCVRSINSKIVKFDHYTKNLFSIPEED